MRRNNEITPEDEERMLKRQKQLASGGVPKVSAARVIKGTSGNAQVCLIESIALGDKTNFIKLKAGMIGKTGDPESDFYDVVHSKTPTQVEREMLREYPDLPFARENIRMKRGQIFNCCNFTNSNGTIIPTGTRLTLSGLVFEVGHYKGKDSEDSAMQQGDAYIDFKCESFTVDGYLTPAEIRMIFKDTPVGRLEDIMPKCTVPYPMEPRMNVKYEKKGKKDPEERDNCLVHLGVPTETLLTKVDPVVILHMRNSFTFHIVQKDKHNIPFPAEYTQEGPVLVISPSIPQDTACLVLKSKDGVETMGVRGRGDYLEKNFRLITANSVPFGDFFGNFRQEHKKDCGIGGILELGVSTISRWQLCGQSLLRGLDCFIAVNIDTSKSLSSSSEGDYLLVAKWGFNMFYINFSGTFLYSGLKVPFEMAKEVLVQSKPKEDSVVQRKLAARPETVRCICLNEYKGPLDQFQSGWDFYCVPPGNENPDLMETENAGLYLEWQNFHVLNETNTSTDFVKTNYMSHDSLMRKLSVFAVRQDA